MKRNLYISIDIGLSCTVECTDLVKRGDTLDFTFKMFNKGTLRDLTGQAVTLNIEKPDGKIVEAKANINTSTVTASVGVQGAVLAGTIEGDLKIKDTDGSISSNTFTFTVQDSVSSDILEKSQDVIASLDEVRELVLKWNEQVELIGVDADAVEALNGIKNYIDNTLPTLQNEIAWAKANLSTLDTKNSTASTNITNLINKIAIADDLLDKFRLYDPTNLIQQVQNNTASLSKMTHDKWDYVIKTTDEPQTIIDSAPAGSKITFEGGVHEHGLTKNNAMISIEKPITLNIPSTATLKVADGSMTINKNAEIITNFHANNPITGLLINSDGYTLDNTVRTYEILIDSVGVPNTFKYQIRDFNNATVKDWVTGVAITGDYQTLADGITIKFPQTTGYTVGAGCIIAIGSVGYYVIRVGKGTHEDYINGVYITGDGIIEQNQTNNAKSNLYALWLNCGLLINGRVTNFFLQDRIHFNDCNRTIVILGENIGGTYNLDGTVTGGISYDVEGVTITNTLSDNCISGALFGMPEHRGIIKKLNFDNNSVVCELTGIEPNNLLQDYSIKNNKIYTTQKPIHCWRYSKNGVISGNIGYGTTEKCVTVDTPSGWKIPENIFRSENFISDESHIMEENMIINPSENSIAKGIKYSSILNGSENYINASYCENGGLNNQSLHGVTRIFGKYGVTRFPYSDVFATGKLETEGDCQVIKCILKTITDNVSEGFLTLDGTALTTTNSISIINNGTYSFRINVVCRGSDTSTGSWRIDGIFTKQANGVEIKNSTVTEIFKSYTDFGVQAVASTSTGQLALKCTSKLGLKVKWNAYVELVEIVF